ncbi:MAG: GNAT family N-acetyltransferase [Pseudonocardiaceae bacterium]
MVLIPYFSTLGPVQSRALSAQLLNAVVDIADTGRFLSYDKDRRWSSKKAELVIVEGIVHEPGLTIIPTFTRGRGLVKIHHYGDSLPQLSELAQWTRLRWTTFSLAAGRVIWFQRAPEGARTRLLPKIFWDQDKHDRSDVIQLTDCAVADTFPAFAEELGAEGFAFLYQRMKAGLPDGPILVRVEDRRIVGAVGPLGTLLDSTGTRMQPPQYFAVHPHYRRRGHGRALWRAAMAWGADNGATY